MGRCLDQYRLFPDDGSCEYFLTQLGGYLDQTASRCYAWALMGNHYHLLLRLGDVDLWKVMKPLNMRYAQYHARITGRRGPLFMDRYKSIVTQDQNYVQELVRYVHLNPVRAGMVKNIRTLERYPWCGHGALMGIQKRDFQDVQAVLNRFGRRTDDARKMYCQYLQEGVEGDSGEDTLTAYVRKSNSGAQAGRKPHCWVIGDQKFVADTIKSAHARRLRISRFNREGASLRSISRKVCSRFSLPADTVLRRHRGGVSSDARKAFACVAAEAYNAPVKEIALYLGVSSAAVSTMIRDGRDIVRHYGIVI